MLIRDRFSGDKMTILEVSKRYSIPIKVLKEYERWGLCNETKEVVGGWQYDQQDIKSLSMVMTLYDIGFTSKETKNYMKLLLQGKETREMRLEILNKHRKNMLDEIHFKQSQLDRLDYLKYKIEKNDR